MALRLSTAMRSGILGDTATYNNSFKDMFQDGIIDIYSGSQPADADAAETGTQLLRITESGGAFTPSSPTNGLEFGDASGGSISKAAAETWQGDGITGGVAGYFRFYDNDVDTGADATAMRFDGAVATSGAELNLSSTTIVQSATTTIDAFTITLPAS